MIVVSHTKYLFFVENATLNILIMIFICTELGSLEWDTINPDCLIRISNVDTFDVMLNPLFFWI